MTNWQDDLKKTEATLEQKTTEFEDKIKEFEKEKDTFEVIVFGCAWHQHACARVTAHAHMKNVECAEKCCETSGTVRRRA